MLEIKHFMVCDGCNQELAVLPEFRDKPFEFIAENDWEAVPSRIEGHQRLFCPTCRKREGRITTLREGLGRIVTVLGKKKDSWTLKISPDGGKWCARLTFQKEPGFDTTLTSSCHYSSIAAVQEVLAQLNL